MKEQKCSLSTIYSKEKKSDVFFSTTWCRDRLFSSNSKEEIKRLYDTFQSREELIQWMKDRPKGRTKVFEIEGNKDVIVVIPTADFEGNYAKECRENIFRGLHIIFVESGYPKDPYFNYSHSCNIGIKRALEYAPKWIVVSNDDMSKIDDSSVLLQELMGKDENRVKSIFTRPSQYHSIPVCNGRPRPIIGGIGEFLYLLLTGEIDTRIYLATKRIARRFNAKWSFAPSRKLYRRIFYSETRCYVLTSDFSIFSGKWAKDLNGEIFNETYLNGVEDWELSLQLCENSQNFDFIEYRIGDIVGGTIGGYMDKRTLRDSANMIYFDARISEKFSRNTNQK